MIRGHKGAVREVKKPFFTERTHFRAGAIQAGMVKNVLRDLGKLRVMSFVSGPEVFHAYSGLDAERVMQRPWTPTYGLCALGAWEASGEHSS